MWSVVGAARKKKTNFFSPIFLVEIDLPDDSLWGFVSFSVSALCSVTVEWRSPCWLVGCFIDDCYGVWTELFSLKKYVKSLGQEEWKSSGSECSVKKKIITVFKVCHFLFFLGWNHQSHSQKRHEGLSETLLLSHRGLSPRTQQTILPVLPRQTSKSVIINYNLVFDKRVTWLVALKYK